jgi:hypothetical protein
MGRNNPMFTGILKYIYCTKDHNILGFDRRCFANEERREKLLVKNVVFLQIIDISKDDPMILE